MALLLVAAVAGARAQSSDALGAIAGRWAKNCTLLQTEIRIEGPQLVLRAEAGADKLEIRERIVKSGPGFVETVLESCTMPKGYPPGCPAAMPEGSRFRFELDGQGRLLTYYNGKLGSTERRCQ